jgi:hypothetical protein
MEAMSPVLPIGLFSMRGRTFLSMTVAAWQRALSGFAAGPNAFPGRKPFQKPQHM